MTWSAICAAGGASATQGDLAVTSKNTDPDNCTAERTSDSASVLIGTLRRTMALSATRPGHASTCSGRSSKDDSRSGGSSKRSGGAIIQRTTRLLWADHSQLPLRREIPDHGSDQQKRRHVADQVTHFVSIVCGLYRHDAGMHDARPDRE